MLTCVNAGAQNIHFKINTISELEQQVVDSINYQKIHQSKNNLSATIQKTTTELQQKGFINATITNYTIVNDTLATATATLNNRIKNILLYKETISTEATSLLLTKDSILIPFASIESYLKDYTKQLELEGYAMAKVQLRKFRESGETLIAELFIDSGTIREINEIVISGYNNFPKGHRKNIERLFKNSTFTPNNLERVRKEFDKLPFVQQSKSPEILFTTDTTKIYVYLEKANSNKFDGIIGFSNDDESSKVVFNGYLDLQLNNALKTGETFELYWKSDGQKQTTFKSSVELPYIFKSPFALKASLNIFKQDSTFQNTKTAIEGGYYLSYNKRFFAGYQATESSDIQNLNSLNVKDYKNSFFTSSFEFSDYKPELFLFPYKTLFNIKTGIGQRMSKDEKIPQFFIETNLEHDFYLNDKNVIWVKNTNYYLKSAEYLVGELFRFGGSKSIRGFAENTLQGNLALLLSTEYRYLLSPTLYAHTILDYGYYSDDSRLIIKQNQTSLIGAGIGFGISTKIGLFNISYANGILTNEALDFQNSIVHISFNTKF